MEKETFHQLLTNYTALSQEEALAILTLQRNFPYSQVLHGLAARAAQDNNLTDKEHQLHLSAIYSTDRAVLKTIMTALQQPRVAEVKLPAKQTALVEPVQSLETPLVQTDKESLESEKLFQPTNLSGDALNKEVMHDIEILRKKKAMFEKMVANLEKRIPVSTEAPKSKKIKGSDPDEGLLNEIKNHKKKIKPEGEKQKEQIEIIDQFIKVQPTIPKLKPNESQTKSDLSEPSVTYGDNIVSETLVEILLKQGKKDKAIEVLKKLIWKFPQKKAYFAARIEELKK